MLIELIVATGMVLLTVILHGAGLLGLGKLLEWRDRRAKRARLNALSPEGAMIASVGALALMTLHGVEIWIYAVLYIALGAIEGLREAVYFSTSAYASIGFSDRMVVEDWRLLGAIEGINGGLLLGWSVAFFVTVMTRFTPMGRQRR